jgi:hypothetical protein
MQKENGILRQKTSTLILTYYKKRGCDERTASFDLANFLKETVWD